MKKNRFETGFHQWAETLLLILAADPMPNDSKADAHIHIDQLLRDAKAMYASVIFLSNDYWTINC